MGLLAFMVSDHEALMTQAETVAEHIQEIISFYCMQKLREPVNLQ